MKGGIEQFYEVLGLNVYSLLHTAVPILRYRSCGLAGIGDQVSSLSREFTSLIYGLHDKFSGICHLAPTVSYLTYFHLITLNHSYYAHL